MKIIVVGSGLFGSIATALARKAGHSVTLVDNANPLAASKCSGNLFKPSWLESIGKEKAAVAYGVLRSLYTVQKIDCVIRPLLKLRTALDWIDPAEVLLPPDAEGTVTEVGDGYVKSTSGNTLRGTVLVAAGVGCDQLVSMPHIKRLVGSSLRLKGQVKEASVYLYAPYKHAVAFNLNKWEVWCGDGAAILEKNWAEDDRVTRLKQRARDFFGLKGVEGAEVRVGARPYVEGFKQGYFAQVYPRTYVSTGGAKNGVILAAYQAQQFLEAIS
jgi:glycine/D-amino acid oxidase-like deaminating enzyme